MWRFESAGGFDTFASAGLIDWGGTVTNRFSTSASKFSFRVCAHPAGRRGVRFAQGTGLG